MKNGKPQPRHSGLDPESRKPTEAVLDVVLRRHDEAEGFICNHPRSSAAN